MGDNIKGIHQGSKITIVPFIETSGNRNTKMFAKKLNQLEYNPAKHKIFQYGIGPDQRLLDSLLNQRALKSMRGNIQTDMNKPAVVYNSNENVYKKFAHKHRHGQNSNKYQTVIEYLKRGFRVDFKEKSDKLEEFDYDLFKRNLDKFRITSEDKELQAMVLYEKLLIPKIGTERVDPQKKKLLYDFKLRLETIMNTYVKTITTNTKQILIDCNYYFLLLI